MLVSQGCSSSSTTSTWLLFTKPTFRSALLHRQQFLLPYYGSFPGGTAPARGCSCGGSSRLWPSCHIRYCSACTAALRDLLHVVPVGCRRQCAPPHAPPGLWRASAACLEHLLQGTLVPAGLFLSFSTSLPAAVTQYFFCFLNLLSQRNPVCSWLTSGNDGSLLEHLELAVYTERPYL